MADDKASKTNPVVIPSPDYSFTRVKPTGTPYKTTKDVHQPEIQNISSKMEIPTMWIQVRAKDDDALSCKDSLLFDNPTYNLTTPQYDSAIWESALTPAYFKDYFNKLDDEAQRSLRKKNITYSLVIALVVLLFIVGVGIGLYFIVIADTNSTLSEDRQHADHNYNESHQVTGGLQGRLWSDDLGDPGSDHFKELAQELELELDKAFLNSDLAPQFNRTEVISFHNGDTLTVKWVVHLLTPRIISEENLKKSVHAGFTKVQENGETSGSSKIDAKNSNLSITLGSMNRTAMDSTQVPTTENKVDTMSVDSTSTIPANRSGTLLIENTTSATNRFTTPSADHITIPSEVLSCQFEAGDDCGYTSMGEENFSWGIVSPGQRYPSPAHDHTTNSDTGSYMYAGGSYEGDPGDVALLQSRIYSGHVTGGIKFAYILHGGATLEVTNILDSSMSLQFGPPIPNWMDICLNITGSVFTQILFKATRGGATDSYVALDDIEFIEEQCEKLPEGPEMIQQIIPSYVPSESPGQPEGSNVSDTCIKIIENYSKQCPTLGLISQHKTLLENCGYLMTGLDCANAAIAWDNLNNCTITDWHILVREQRALIEQMFHFNSSVCVDVPLVQEIGGTVCASSGRLLTNGTALQDINSICRIYVDFVGCLVTVISYYNIAYTVKDIIEMTEINTAVQTEFFGDLNTSICRENDFFSLPIISLVTSSDHCYNTEIIRYIITYDCQHALQAFLEEEDVRDKCSELQSISYCVSHAVSSIFRSKCSREEVHAVIMKSHAYIFPSVDAQDIQQCKSMLPCDISQLQISTCTLILSQTQPTVNQSQVCRIFSHTVACLKETIEENPNLDCSMKQIGRRIEEFLPSLSLSGCEVASNMSSLCSDTSVVELVARQKCDRKFLNDANLTCGPAMFGLQCLSMWLEPQCSREEILLAMFTLRQTSLLGCSAVDKKNGLCVDGTDVHQKLLHCLSFLQATHSYLNSSEICRISYSVLACMRKEIQYTGILCSLQETREIARILPSLSIPEIDTCPEDTNAKELCSDPVSTQIVASRLCTNTPEKSCSQASTTLDCSLFLLKAHDCTSESVINNVYELLESYYSPITNCSTVVNQNCTDVDFILNNEDYCVDEKANIVNVTPSTEKCLFLESISSCLQKALYKHFAILCAEQVIRTTMLKNPKQVAGYLSGFDNISCSS